MENLSPRTQIPQTLNHDIIVAGGGWAGLAASVALTAHGYRVCLLEAAPQAGGRARQVQIGGRDLDNGQHILLGAYHELCQLLGSLGLDQSAVLTRHRLKLDLDCLNGHGMRLRMGRLFSPMHMLTALLGARGLTLFEKGQISRCWLSLQMRGFKLTQDIAVGLFLEQHGQSPRVQALFWRPVCIAALNTDIDKASMQIFMNVLKRSFTGQRSNSDVLLPKGNLHTILPGPASDFIRQHGGQVLNGERLQGLRFDDEGICGVDTTRGHRKTAKLILAMPYHQTLKLLQAHSQFDSLTHSLANLTDEPITTLYMQFPAHVRITHTMHGLCDGISQWFIDRRSCGQPGMIAVVISASGTHKDMPRESLISAILAEVKSLFPQWPDPDDCWLIREKKATFSCTPAANALRPAPGPIGANICLAGDYCATGLPATLEGAVASGLQCADHIIKHS